MYIRVEKDQYNFSLMLMYRENFRKHISNYIKVKIFVQNTMHVNIFEALLRLI